MSQTVVVQGRCTGCGEWNPLRSSREDGSVGLPAEYANRSIHCLRCGKKTVLRDENIRRVSE